ncbi:MAG: DUF3786 domain-containing protein [Pseudomonadota bacterium]
MIDPLYFKELSAQDPADICRRAGCEFDPAGKAFILSFWGDTFRVDPKARSVVRLNRATMDTRDKSATFLGLLIVFYLLHAREVVPSLEWISEKDIPGGATFFRGPHKIPTDLMEVRYSGDVKAFCRRCVQLNGSPLDMADAAYRFTLTPRLPVAVQFWDGDTEFPPEAKLLFDRTISQHLTPDIIFCLAVVICHRMAPPDTKD